jgi:hypothetical protein
LLFGSEKEKIWEAELAHSHRIVPSSLLRSVGRPRPKRRHEFLTHRTTSPIPLGLTSIIIQKYKCGCNIFSLFKGIEKYFSNQFSVDINILP